MDFLYHLLVGVIKISLLILSDTVGSRSWDAEVCGFVIMSPET